jgi:small conductance mechanosensitive channel
MFSLLLALQDSTTPPSGATPDPAAGAASGSSPPADPTTAQGLVDQYGPLLVDYGIKAGGVLIFLFIGWLVASWLGRLTQRGLEKARVELTLTRFIGKIVKWAILVFVLMGCLSRFGIQMTSFAAVIAALGLAIGLAFQGSLSNFAAGMMLLIFRPFKVGDVVSVAGHIGSIFEIDILSTALDTFDNRRIIVPNSSIFGSTIENITFHKTRRVDVPVGIAYDADIDHTRAVLNSAIEMIEKRLKDPAPQVLLADFADSSINWVVRVWAPTVDYWDVREALIRAIKVKLDEAGITIPFPQRDVHVFQETVK